MFGTSTKLNAAECDSVAWAICDSRTTVLPSPTGRSTRNGETSVVAAPSPPTSRSPSRYTDMGTMARMVEAVVTGSPLLINQFRSAPAIVASTTSLTSQSYLARTRR